MPPLACHPRTSPPCMRWPDRWRRCAQPAITPPSSTPTGSFTSASVPPTPTSGRRTLCAASGTTPIASSASIRAPKRASRKARQSTAPSSEPSRHATPPSPAASSRSTPKPPAPPSSARCAPLRLPMPDPPPVFDRSFLPPADCELVVFSDTHYLLHPELQGGEWPTIREFPGRAGRALQLAAAL